MSVVPQLWHWFSEDVLTSVTSGTVTAFIVARVVNRRQSERLRRGLSELKAHVTEEVNRALVNRWVQEERNKE